MCGRFSLRKDIEELSQHFSLIQHAVLKPRYNIAPNNVVPVIRKYGYLEFITWGLRPHWLKPEQDGFINARLETIREKPAFKSAFKQQRCLILADGYYEWKQIGNIKQPFFIHLPANKVFAIGGIYSQDTCAIITVTTINQQLAKIHDRMPLIIDPAHYVAWLEDKNNDFNVDACGHKEFANSLQFFPVSRAVNNPKHDFVQCIEALQ